MKKLLIAALLAAACAQAGAAVREADLMNTSIGMADSVRRWFISQRPRAQVMSRVKATMPTSSGNHPPSLILVRLAVK